MSTSKDCKPNGPDLLSPRTPFALIGVLSLLLAAFALLKFVEVESKATELSPRE